MRQSGLNGAVCVTVTVGTAAKTVTVETVRLVAVVVVGMYRVASVVVVMLVVAVAGTTSVADSVVRTVAVFVTWIVLVDVPTGVGIDKHEQALDTAEEAKEATKGGSLIARSSSSSDSADRLAASGDV